jgi:WD40 repeat protein
LSGEHECTITALAVTHKGNYVFSGGEDGKIVIWRTSDCNVLHVMKVKNVSRIVSLSVHNSDRMLLALYANGMLRLWNLLDARCIFKRKVGVPSDEESVDEDEEEEPALKLPFKIKPANMTPERVQWEPTKGMMYAVLFNRMLEIYNVEAAKDGEPLHSISFDSNQTSFDFITATDILVGDEKGRVTVLS